MLPRSNTPDSDFRDEDVNVRIPLETTTKGMENANETRSETLSFIEFAEHAKNDIADGMKKAVEKRAISAEEDAKLLRDGKNAMSMNRLDDFERHGSSTLDRIEITTGRAETAFAAKRNEFERTTRRTPIHSTAVRRVE